MKVAFIHNDKKLGTGAHFINDLMASRLREAGVRVKSFYPRHPHLASAAQETARDFSSKAIAKRLLRVYQKTLEQGSK